MPAHAETPRRRRGTRLAVAGLAAAMLGIGAPAGAAPTAEPGPSGCADVVVSLRTFHLTIEPQRPAYRAGQTARIDVTVTRPAAEDPLGLGVGVEPPGEVPAADVGVGLGIRVGEAFLTGSQRSDEDGAAVVEIPIPKSVSPGPAEASAFAWETWLRGGCLIVEEWGHRREPGLFKVRPAKR